MELGIVGTNGKLAWGHGAGRIMLDGETLGKRVVMTIQNHPGWRCSSCRLLVVDYSHLV